MEPPNKVLSAIIKSIFYASGGGIGGFLCFAYSFKGHNPESLSAMQEYKFMLVAAVVLGAILGPLIGFLYEYDKNKD